MDELQAKSKAVGPETETKAKTGTETKTATGTVMSLHSMHCGGACMLKLHMKDGRVCRITSAGDIPREGSHDQDESLMPIQRRACPMGLSEKRRIFAPDRLKYPLKQTLERGNIRGFKHISWEEALDTVAEWYREMEKRKEELGYLPVLDEGGISPYLGPHLRRWGNSSSGNLQAAAFGAIGNYAALQGNPPIDAFNSRYIVLWGNDAPTNFPYYAFYLMKAKEAGIPVTVVDARYTDSAAAMGTGDGSKPRYICVRPATDGALLAAMANVIYRRDLHDKEFLKDYCFGFFPGDTVVSRSPAKHPVTGEPYFGKAFTVPEGQSFVEYLDDLEREHGGYEGVLNWAEKLTGVEKNVIETFAIEYATAKPAFIFSKLTGPQRTHNGMYFSWMLIAISAMTGNTNKRGGGFGEVRFDDGYSVRMDPAPPFSSMEPYAPIYFPSYSLNDVILHGRDERTPDQRREDVLEMNGIDLGPGAGLKLEMYVRGAGEGNIFNQIPNINKRVLAWKKLKHVVAYESAMSSTAAWSDIILPSAGNFEVSRFQGQLAADVFAVNGPMDPMYEAKPDWWINEQLAQRLGIPYNPRVLSDREIMKRQWETAEMPKDYLEIDPEAKLPGFEEIMKTGNFQLPVPKEKTVIQLAMIEPGEFDTDTGRINFYSPYFAERGRAVLKVTRAQYVRPWEGYEDVLEGDKTGAKGIVYRLQFITPHAINRALTTYGNVPVLDEQKPHAVVMHPDDAVSRDIHDGDTVYVFNDFGCIKLPASISRRVRPGVVSIGQGVTYRPSIKETYDAFFDADGDGKPEPHIVPVDVGGCVNTITGDRNSGVLDPHFCGLGLNAGGALCEVSRVKPGSGPEYGAESGGAR
ncbi:MAG TPA: molybdopterin-dependent oxidoreductase [Anaerovoracaceae bacterium]|nr:molybdopterin-dependent oxidoreductase [Anaerovoracaceae bacterium]